MEILKNKHANIDISLQRIVSCEHCESELCITESDIHSGKITIFNEIGQSEIAYFKELITCPCCGRETRPCCIIN